MTVITQARLTDTAEAVQHARELLEHNQSILVLAEDVAPFAMLVNEYGDLIHTVEISEGAKAERAAIVTHLQEATDVVDAIVVIDRSASRAGGRPRSGVPTPG